MTDPEHFLHYLEFLNPSLAEKIEDAVEAFLKQAPGCEAGEIALGTTTTFGA